MQYDIRALLEALNPDHHIEQYHICFKCVRDLKTYYSVRFRGRGKSKLSPCGQYDGAALDIDSGVLLSFDNDPQDVSACCAAL